MTADCSSLFKLSLNTVMFHLNNHQNQHLIWVLSDLTSLAAVLILTAVYSSDRLLLHYLKAEFVLNSSVVKGLLNLKPEGILSAVNWHLQLCDDWHDSATARVTARMRVTVRMRMTVRMRTTATMRIKTRATVRTTARCQCLENRVSRCSKYTYRT